MAHYGAVARRQRSAPVLGSESQPLLGEGYSPTSSTTTVNDIGDHPKRKNAHEHNFFSNLLSRPRVLQDPEDRLFKDGDEETWASTQLGAPDMVASNLVITLSTA